jgi:phosphoglucosamine mutase
VKFGTDGLRGRANVELTPELALALGRAGARVIGGGRWAVGRDPRLSGPMLEAAFAAGLASEGVEVASLGVVPTPAVAWWSRQEGIPAAVVSASHNPFEDNGIKIFGGGGLKLSDAVEGRIEEELARVLRGPSPATPSSTVGGLTVADAATGYAAAVVSSLGEVRLEPLRLVVDCANGAASAVAPAVLRELGAAVELINAAPDGVNINTGCGSTHPEALQSAVATVGADVGVAFDGDADRVLLVDAAGNLVDGDQIMAVLATDLDERGLLHHHTVVVTVMTNLGFRLAMEKAGIQVVETAVGDRYVLEAIEKGGFALGGEQSGHVIFRDLATTGDGLLTAVQVLGVMVRTGRPLADLAAAAMVRLPQVLRNVQVAERDPAIVDRIAGDVAEIEAELGAEGRVLVRPSGTEPLIRVMVEAPTEDVASRAADRLAAAVATAAGT